MGQLGKSFQRIRYHRLRFEIVAGWPSTVSGAYVAGFVKDATDPVTSATASSTLLASGGTAVKFWQSTNVMVGNLPDLYYTSSAPDAERWASPGSFVIAAVGAPNVSATFEIFCHWDVSFSEPTYEADSRASGFTTCLTDAYTSQGNKYLSKRKGSDWEPLTYADFSPALYTDVTVTVLSMRYASVQNSSSVLSGVFGFRQMKATGGKVYPVDELGKTSSQSFFDETYALFTGEKVELFSPPNELTAPWFLSTLGRHVRSGLSKPQLPRPMCAPERKQTPLPCCWTDSSSGTNETRTTRSSKGVITLSERLRKLSKILPGLETADLLPLMERWTASQLQLKAASINSSDEEEFDGCADAQFGPPKGDTSPGEGAD